MMQRSLSTSLTALAGLLLLSVGVYAQSTCSISGKVIGEDGQPLKDALIKIDRKDIKGSYKVKTNKKGEYFHAGLPFPGTYDVGIEVNGKLLEQMTARNVRGKLGDPTPVDFNLAEVKKRSEAISAAAASGGTLTKEQARDMTPEQKAAMEKAMKDREAAMSKNKELNASFNAGVTALQAGQVDAAITALVKASELDPKQSVVWAHLADAYTQVAKSKTGAEKQDAYTKGFDAYNKALEIKPDDASAHNNYALALAASGKFPEAQAELNKAAQYDAPNAGKYYYNLGALLVNSGQLEPAADAFKKAIEADPNYADAHYQLGIYFISKAQVTPDGKITPVAGTKEEFQKYLELKPDGPNAQASKDMLASMDAKIDTEYKNPAAPKKGATKKK